VYATQTPGSARVEEIQIVDARDTCAKSFKAVNDEVLRMYKQDLVAAVQEVVAPLVAENKALAAELAAANTKIDKMLGYHVDDHNRIKELEAALREAIQGYLRAEQRDRFTKLLSSVPETLVDLKDPHNAHHPDRLKGPGLTAQETKADDWTRGKMCAVTDCTLTCAPYSIHCAVHDRTQSDRSAETK
jgi:hypothetical protein